MSTFFSEGNTFRLTFNISARFGFTDFNIYLSTASADDQIRKCQYNCQETKSFKKQVCTACNPNDCPDKYAEFISTGMLVCSELQQTKITSSITYGVGVFEHTINIPTLMLGMVQYRCEYAKCKRVLFVDPDVYLECPENPFEDVDNCNSAGDALIDQDKMFIELDGVFY